MNGIEYVGEHTFIGQFGHALLIVAFVAALFSSISYFLAVNRWEKPEWLKKVNESWKLKSIVAGLAVVLIYLTKIYYSTEGASVLTLVFAIGVVFLMKREEEDSWRKMGRGFFWLHSLTTVTAIALMFFMLWNEYFEYDFIWKHSNLTMPMKYIMSCFWEGQEGSFLLWSFWHIVLANILIWTAGRWESPTMAVIALVQAFLGTMVLGLYFFGQKWGSSPFILIRELPENLGLPWTTMPEYLSMEAFQDGRGLNPLLRNYWMTIHPPTVFLGYASVIIPFAYAIAGLWKRQFTEWLKPALPWTYFSIMILGTGILMGGAWAYEALSFGGFWAWDPVENAVLVPWITLVGAGHLMLINKRKGTSLFTMYCLTLLSFILVLYSNFLTGSGILGDTSVHSFTGEGFMGLLVICLLFFVALSVYMLMLGKKDRLFYAGIVLALFIFAYVFSIHLEAIALFTIISGVMLVVGYRKHFPKSQEEEGLWTREFWLFIGALVLMLSAFQVAFFTSTPVHNALLEPFAEIFKNLHESTGIGVFEKLGGAELVPPADAISFYNKWQIPFAFIITLLVAVGQYFSYKKTDMKVFGRRILIAVVISVLITIAGSLALDYGAAQLNYIMLFFAATFAVVANLEYLIKVAKGKLDRSGPSVAHIGFALVMLGALISTGSSDEVSKNRKGVDLRFLNEEFSNEQDIQLYKGDTVPMGENFVHYKEKNFKDSYLKFEVEYFEQLPKHYAKGDLVRMADVIFRAKNDHVAGEAFLTDQDVHWEVAKDGEADKMWTNVRPGELQFTLQPNVLQDETFGMVAEPSTQHYLDHDLYTHVRYADLRHGEEDGEGWMPPRVYEKNVGDTIMAPACIIFIQGIDEVRDTVQLKELDPDIIVHKLTMRVQDIYDPRKAWEINPVIVTKLGETAMTMASEVPELRVKIEVANLTEKGMEINLFEEEYVVMQAIVFPMINILWMGCILMALGSFMAVRARIRQGRKDRKKAA